MEHQDMPSSTGAVQPREHGPDAINLETTKQEPTKTDKSGPALGGCPPVHQLFPNWPGDIQRSGSLPTRSSRRDTDTPDTPRRGATISSRAQNTKPSSPSRVQATGPSNPTKLSPAEMDRRDPIPQTKWQRASGDDASLRQDRSGNSGRPRFTTSQGTQASSACFCQGNSTLNQQRPLVVLDPRLFRQSDVGFSLAGHRPIEVVLANQASELNPEYGQPWNVQPFPMRGIARARRESEEQSQDLEHGGNRDLEQGMIEPTLRSDTISSQLQNSRQNPEHPLFSTYSRKAGQGAANVGVPTSNDAPINPPSNVIAGGEGSGGPNRFPSLEGHYGAFSAGSQATEQPSEEVLYPKDLFSAPTEPDDERDISGNELHRIPIKARLWFKEPLAELLAVTVQLTLGFCADLAVTVSQNQAGNEATTDWSWGLATMVAIYIAGGISGAHLNPAVTIMLCSFRKFPLRKMPLYILAQVLGAYLAGLIAFGLYQKNIIAFGGSDLANSNTVGAFLTYPRQPCIDFVSAFFNEFTATTILAIAILAIGDAHNAPPAAGMGPVVMGLTVTVCSMAFGYNTGAAMNPSRDLGPRLAVLSVGYGSSVFSDYGYWWLYGPWAATITGANFGAFLYDTAVFVGTESPIKLSHRRIKRAGRKWRAKWSRRMNTIMRRPGRGI